MEIVDSAESILLVSFMAGGHCWMALLIVNAVKSLHCMMIRKVIELSPKFNKRSDCE